MKPTHTVRCHAGGLVRYRRLVDRRLLVIAARELAAITHIPGDISADECERRYQAALAEIRRRRRNVFTE